MRGDSFSSEDSLPCGDPAELFCSPSARRAERRVDQLTSAAKAAPYSTYARASVRQVIALEGGSKLREAVTADLPETILILLRRMAASSKSVANLDGAQRGKLLASAVIRKSEKCFRLRLRSTSLTALSSHL